MTKELPDDAPVKFYAFLDSQDFYELMQAYRLAPIDAAKEFEAVRFALRAAIAQPTPAEYAQGYAEGFNDACKPAQPEQPAVLSCKKCGGEMAPGQAIAQTFRGINDFIGDKTVCTISPCGPGKLVPCMKCIDCGWSTS